MELAHVWGKLHRPLFRIYHGRTRPSNNNSLFFAVVYLDESQKLLYHGLDRRYSSQ
jgi:hypothetical protein